MTGTELTYQHVKNRDWFEEKLLGMNNNCLDNLLETSNSNMIVNYIAYYNSLKEK